MIFRTAHQMMPYLTIILGEALEKLRELPSESVECCVTSPPYWGLRDYGTAEWEGGESDCVHIGTESRTVSGGDGKQYTNTGSNRVFSGDCKCGAKRIDAQLGLEKMPEEYVASVVEIFREVRRVLRNDGTLWLNLGDSYASTGRSDRKESPGVGAKQEMRAPGREIVWKAGGGSNFSWTLPGGQKPKDLIGIPWRVAFALQADGWYLRQDIIWSKPNPMPESVTDRCTKAHEYLFLLTKSPRYFYDAEAIKERTLSLDPEHPSFRPNSLEISKNGRKEFHAKHEMSARSYDQSGRNKRSVWTVATQPYSEAHFATYPPDLIKPCVLAGTRVGDTVLDPFAGSGTTGAVALELGRNAILIELNPAYVQLIEERCTITLGLAL
jgi:DNA modification methylase